MTVKANTFQSTSAVGNREELSDVVNRITPEDTPVYSTIGDGQCVSTNPEWETDEIEAPGENVIEEGAEYDFDAITPPERMGNKTQIMRKTFRISGTQEAVDEAGNIQKTKKQKLKKGIAIRKDVELAILTPTATVGGATRKFGSLPTWIETNVSRGATGANGGYSSGTGLTVAPTDGTQRAFAKALLDDVAQQGYTSGANFRHAFVSPYVKSVFVSFISDANVASFRYAATGSKNTIVANADIYEGPFGKLMIQPNRVMAENANVARNVHLLDPEYVKFCWLKNRKIHEVKNLANTGDAKQGVLIGEGTLKIDNEKGLGVIADVFGLTAST